MPRASLPIPRWRPQSDEALGRFGDLITCQLGWPTFPRMIFLACFQQGWLHCLPQFRYQKGFPRLHRIYSCSVQFGSVQSLSCVRLSVTPWTAAHQASLSITNLRSLLILMPIESVMPSSHLILCHPLLLLPHVKAFT